MALKAYSSVLRKALATTPARQFTVTVGGKSNKDVGKLKLSLLDLELQLTKGKPLYMDNQATTPLDPRVLDAMLPYMTNIYGNPHSTSHSYGWESERASEQAREVRKDNESASGQLDRR